jgi:hypothetical protein
VETTVPSNCQIIITHPLITYLVTLSALSPKL